jgi:hypothetical protein
MLDERATRWIAGYRRVCRHHSSAVFVAKRYCVQRENQFELMAIQIRFNAEADDGKFNPSPTRLPDA